MNTAMLKAFSALEALRQKVTSVPLRQRFADDPERFSRFSVSASGLLLDYSKNLIDAGIMERLFAVAEAAEVEAYRDRMFAGAPVNVTEHRPALHVALRAGPGEVYRIDGVNVVPEVHAVLGRMAGFAEGVRSGSIGGAGGAFTDIVSIGIGGSDLGPAMAVAALKPFHTGPRVHFVSNVDGAHIRDTIAGIDPARTLVLIASKTFTTVETMTNAASARRWIVDAVGADKVGDHFAAISTAGDKVAAFGIEPERMFGFWDWVGGRFSIWSAIGLPLMMAVGAGNFRSFLDGGRAIDDHFRTAPLAASMPTVMAMIGVWNRNVLGFPALAVLPYDQRLARLPAYLQQLDMESNGKRVRLLGASVMGATGPVVFGEPGTSGQHAFFQLLHQGTDVVPCDFLLGALPDTISEESHRHHALLVANCLAQSEALMRGRTLAEAREELKAAGLPAAEANRLAPHKVFPGNRPSNTILYRHLDPHTLGSIVALYEHKIFVQGVIWGINSFDQWGVELGKTLAMELLPRVEGKEPDGDRDASTEGLLAALRVHRGV